VFLFHDVPQLILQYEKNHIHTFLYAYLYKAFRVGKVTQDEINLYLEAYKWLAELEEKIVIDIPVEVGWELFTAHIKLYFKSLDVRLFREYPDDLLVDKYLQGIAFVPKPFLLEHFVIYRETRKATTEADPSTVFVHSGGEDYYEYQIYEANDFDEWGGDWIVDELYYSS
jgi:hypothetical protein